MTTPPTDHLRRARYRAPADGSADAVVLDAALAELRDRGYAEASVRTIAARAHSTPEALFTRWRSKQRLLTDAVTRLAAEQPAPETGDLRTDLLQVAEAFAELLAHPGTAEVLRSLLLSDHGGGSASLPLRLGPLGQRRGVIRRIVERGQRRQQLSSSLHPGVIADALIGALVVRVLAGEQVSGDVVRRIVDVVLGTPVPSGHVGTP
jgi:AcrR family transcriptional regulator